LGRGIVRIGGSDNFQIDIVEIVDAEDRSADGTAPHRPSWYPTGMQAATTTEPRRPSIFIGSSAEGELLAQQLQLNLRETCRTQLWSQGVFHLGSETLQSLVAASQHFDFAALVLTPDDVLEKRGAISPAARDNVVFEAGLFVGALGANRTFLVHCRGEPLGLPSDLLAVTTATYERPEPNDDLRSIMGPPAIEIKNAILQVAATGAGPNYMNAFAALARQLTRDELVRIITAVETGPATGSADSHVPLLRLKEELDARGHDEHTELTREDLRRDCRKYREIRELMPESSPERTSLLEDILGDVTRKARRQTYSPDLVRQLLEGDDGERIVGVTLARVRPHRDNFDAIRSAIVEPRSSFEHAHAIQTMMTMAEELTTEQRRAAQQVVDDLLDDREALKVGGDASRLVLVERLAGELSRLA
jgi:predicted nucleotide-binding protein